MTALAAWSISIVVKKLITGQEFHSFGALENTAFIMFCTIAIINVSYIEYVNFFSLLLVLMMGRFSCGFPFALQIYAFFMVSHYYKKGMQLDEERYAACRH